MSILYIRLPSKAAADAAEHWAALPSPYALASNNGAVEREGTAPLADLSAMAASAARVVLLLAASDVSLLRVKTPPLSPAKLKLALPNLVEDQLMMDPSECVVVPGDMADGLRTAVVAQRGWLEILAQTFTSYGARNLALVPSQLCLPPEDGAAAILVTEHGKDFDLTLRLAPQEALGLPIYPDNADAAPAEVFGAVAALAPARPLVLYVPQALVPAFQNEAARHATEEREIKVFADNWPRIITQLGKAPLNLMSGMSAASGPQINWRQWRWPAVLALLVILVNAIGLNVEWLRMKRESRALQDGMVQIYHSAYPNEPVSDVAAQLQKKIEVAERDAGKAQSDDFLQLAGNFAEVLGNELRNTKGSKTVTNVVASLEYREHSLLVHVKSDSPISMDKIRFALSARKLEVSSPSAGVWQVKVGSSK